MENFNNKDVEMSKTNPKKSAKPVILAAIVLAIVVAAFFFGKGFVSDKNTKDFVDDKNITMDDVEQWYVERIPDARENLEDYLGFIRGFDDFEVQEEKFLFGRDAGWIGCDYVFEFTFTLGGYPYSGTAFGFAEYGNTEKIEWYRYNLIDEEYHTYGIEHYDSVCAEYLRMHFKELLEKYDDRV